jgi:hypothetical protein
MMLFSVPSKSLIITFIYLYPFFTFLYCKFVSIMKKTEIGKVPLKHCVFNFNLFVEVTKYAILK